MPLNPITLQYQESVQGYRLYEMDEQKRAKDLVRAQYLQSRSTAGYNLINGREISNVKNLMSNNIKDGLDMQVHDLQPKYTMY